MTVGDIVIVPFPYLDLLRVKLRPALVVGSPNKDYSLLCQLTSNVGIHKNSIALSDEDYASGSLRKPTCARYDLLFTIEHAIVKEVKATVSRSKMEEIHRNIRSLFNYPSV